MVLLGVILYIYDVIDAGNRFKIASRSNQYAQPLCLKFLLLDRWDFHTLKKVMDISKIRFDVILPVI